ncbi:hypothetical protein [Sphingomonas sp. TX0543]|uniref:hypothetical protein n=2 Tax=unclassified Sphingomonas TaxID=196159 RepID=UPI003AFAE943
MMATNRKPRSTDFNLRRLRSNLLRNATALDRLADLGLGPDGIEALGLGIKEPYVRSDGTEVDGVVAYPLQVAGRRRRYGYLNLDGVTVNGEHAVAWGPGAAATVRAGRGGTALVMGSPMEAWQIGAAAGRLGLEVTALASSQPDALPEEWERPAFWASWDRLILVEGLSSAVAARVVEVARRPVETAAGIEAGVATEHATVQRRHEEWLEEILEFARVGRRSGVRVVDDGDDAAGDFAAAPISVHGGFARGYLFYPFLVERRRAGVSGAEGDLLHSYETLILRSDGAILEPQVLTAPPGTPAGRRVHALTDGTRIEAPPQASRHASWSLSSIQAFAAARASGDDPCGRPPEEILSDVHRFLQSRVHLPDADDVWVATAFVFMTHLFRVFDSLPLLLLTGPRGSGKSELASAAVSLGFNAVMMGPGSAAALVRLTRECGGLIALDDAEGLATQSSGFGELGQCLKVGYKATSARKPIALGSGRIDTIDFYGPRLLTSIRGVDPVLGSRCISLATVPATVALPSVAPPDAVALRDELHCLAMSRSVEVERAYSLLRDASLDRRDEIWAPLLAVAGALGGAGMVAAVGRRRDAERERAVTAAA